MSGAVAAGEAEAMSIQRELIKRFFPQTREEFNKHYPRAESGGMSRQEHIDHAMILVNGVPVGRRLWTRLYPDGETWDDLIGRLKPWLKDDDVFAEWKKMDAFDRFNYLTRKA